MLRHTLSTLALAFAVHSPLPAYAAQPQDADVLGTWKLTKVLDSAEITSMGDQEAARLVGKTVVIQQDKVSIADETCAQPGFERHREPAAKYVRENYHAPVGRLGLPEIVTVVQLGCTEGLVKAKHKMVVFWNGYFYDATKQTGPGKTKR